MMHLTDSIDLCRTDRLSVWDDNILSLQQDGLV